MVKYPKPLKKGDIIGVKAPSSGAPGVFSNKLDSAINKFKELGLNVIETESVRKNNDNLVSAPAEVRAKEFNELYFNKEVRAIIPPWGGEFLMEMLPYLDFKKLKEAEPKWILGFSDTSTLLFTLTLKANLATAHGPNFLDFGNNPVDESVLESLKILQKEKGASFVQESLEYYQEEWSEVTEDTFPPYNLTEKVDWKILGEDTQAQFKGRLIGGNLDVICKLIGTPYDKVKEFLNQYKEDGFIWYFENCEMDSTDVRRTLWQMQMNDWFENCNGLLYGRVAGYNALKGYTCVDALSSIKNELDIPIVYDVDLGHKPPQLTFINGAYAEVTVEENHEKVLQKLI